MRIRRFSNPCSVLIALLSISIYTPFLLFGQLNRGALTGIVTDSSGAAVVNAQIRAVHTSTNVASSTSSTATGDYTLSGLDFGHYRVEVEAPGFKRSVRDDVTITAGATVRLDVSMELGQVTEQIEVTGRPVAIDTDSARVSTNVTNKLVEDIPLIVNNQMRNVFNVALLAPEVKSLDRYRIGGAQGSSWDMMMDGQSLASASISYMYDRGAPIGSISLDAISEFNVETTGSKAEYGRSLGAFTFVTKSGTNQLHGNLFEFLRNNAFDARGFFAAKAPIRKQHDFGFTVGGPVFVPKVYNGKNKTFFFVSYEGYRNRQGTAASYLTVPLPEMYNGDFSGWTRNNNLVQIYDPATTRANPSGAGNIRTPFGGNQIPKARFSRVASAYLTFRDPAYVPNLSGPRLNYVTAAGGEIQPWNKWSVKADHQLNSSNRFSFLYTHNTKTLDVLGGVPPGIPGVFNTYSVWTGKNSTQRFAWDKTITPRILNTFRFMNMRETGMGLAFTEVHDPELFHSFGSKLQIGNVPGPNNGLPLACMTDYGCWGQGGGGGDKGIDWNVSDDLTIIKGSHTFKTGFTLSLDEWWGIGHDKPLGQYDFQSLATAIPADQSGNSGNAFASFLLGYTNNYGLTTPRIVKSRYRYWAGFFQDDWRVTNKLTLNLGIRYEYTMPPAGGSLTGITDFRDPSGGTESGFSNFDPSVPNPGAGGRLGAIVFSGTGTGHTGRGAFDSYKKAFGPRIGLSYRVRSGTVLRMYAGKSFGAVKTGSGSAHFHGYIINNTYSSTDLDVYDFPMLWDNGMPAWTKPPFLDPTVLNGSTAYYWPNSDAGRPPVYYSWNLDLQQQLPGNTVLSIGYSGTRGNKLTSALLNLNQLDPKYIRQYGITLLRSNINSAAARAASIPFPYAGFNGTVQQALLPYPQYQGISTGAPSIGERLGNSSYHALILKADRRYSSGITLLATYTLEKLMSDADTAFASDRTAMDQYNRRLEKGLSWADQTHVARFAFSYELPFGRNRTFGMKGIADKVFGGWGLSGFLQYQSGVPLMVYSGINIIGTTGRPFITSYDNWRSSVSGDSFDPFKDTWWNKSAFQQGISQETLNSTFGNASRNNPKARTPWDLSENVSVAKNVNFTDIVKLQLRFEAFNLFNRVRWGSPDSTLTSVNFGLVRSQANDPRLMQIAAKLVF